MNDHRSIILNKYPKIDKCMKFTEAQLETAIIELLGEAGYPHVLGETIERQPQEVLIKADLRAFLARQYATDGITPGEIEAVIHQLEAYTAADLYESNKAIMKLVSDGFLLKREDRDQKDRPNQLIRELDKSGNQFHEDQSLDEEKLSTVSSDKVLSLLKQKKFLKPRPQQLLSRISLIQLENILGRRLKILG